MHSCTIKTWSNVLALALIISALVIVAVKFTHIQAQTPTLTLQTNLDGYKGGDTATIFGMGFPARDSVTLQVVHADGTAESGNGHEPFVATADASGVFRATWFINPLDSAGNAFLATASTSAGTKATTAFNRIATVRTDKPNYVPGETVIVKGFGFHPNEVVTVQIVAVPNTDPDSPEHQPFITSSDANGMVMAPWYVSPDELDKDLSVTAKGSFSGLSSQFAFRDAGGLNPAANLDQCENGGIFANGSLKPLEPCSNLGGFSDWVHGNVNGSKAHWQEGEFVTYRAVLTGLQTGTNTLQITWDVAKGGKHALDYLGSFDYTETTSLTPSAIHANKNDPCGDIIPGCNPAAPDAISNAIPAADFAGTVAACGTTGTFSGLQIPGNFKAWGAGSITLNGYDSQNVASGASSCNSTMTITFDAQSPTVVLAWGGHIGGQVNWGENNGAGSVSGSPYHMALNQQSSGGQTFNVGAQDRALDASTIAQTITVNKACTISTSDRFNLQVNSVAYVGGVASDAGSTCGGTSGQIFVNSGSNTVSESLNPSGDITANYDSSILCLDELGQPEASGTGTSLSFTVDPGDTITCIITNTLTTAHLTVIKHVINNNGGTKVAANFPITVTGSNVSNPSFNGAESPGTTVTLNAGAYSVSETEDPDYAVSYSADCSGTITAGDSKTCTITNDDNAPALHLRKVVVNDNGGTATASDWTLTATGPTTISGTTPVDSGATFSAGTYALSESGPANYTASAWVCVGGTQSGSNITVGIGGSATCTITNDDNPPSLILHKVVINDNGGTATPANFTLSAAGPTPFSGAGPTVTSGPGFSVGTYALSESGPANYTASAWVCVGGTQSGSNITVGIGGSATCTITNNDIPPSLILNKVVVNDNGGTATPANFVLTASGPTPLSGAGPTVSSGASFSAGTYALSESGPAGYAASAWVCVGGTQSGSNITVGIGGSATCTITNNDIPATIIVKKFSKSGTGTFSFSTTGFVLPNSNTITTTPDGSGNGVGTSGPITVNVGSYSVGEPSQPADWRLDASLCTVDGSTPFGTPTVVGGVNVSWDFTVPLATTVTCTFDDGIVGLTTRTQGFWATHTGLSNTVWNTLVPPADKELCTSPITAIDGTKTASNQLMGGFWANIAHTSGSHKGGAAKRTDLDQARMQMLQQYLAAVLNVYEFGSGSEGLLSYARTIYCSTDVSAIKGEIGVLGTFNSSGDSGIFTPGISATPQESKREADIPFWDTTTH